MSDLGLGQLVRRTELRAHMRAQREILLRVRPENLIHELFLNLLMAAGIPFMLVHAHD